MHLLIIFIPFLFYYLKHPSIVKFLLFLLCISLLGTMLLGRDNEVTIDTTWDLFALVLTSFVFLMIIIPWYSFNNINFINTSDERKVKILTYFLFVINLFPFVIFLITTIIVQTTIKDIGNFKYTQGEAIEFYSTMLPFSFRFFIFSTLIYGFSYFMIPLHFYYLSKKKITLAIICLIFSFNIILHGSTFFSRAVIVEYSFLYLAMFWILQKSIDSKIKRKMLYLLIVPVLFFLLKMFFGITDSRFDNSSYFDKYLINSPIKDPTVYSFFDYLSQWYINGFTVLRDYDFVTFNGKISFESLNNLLGKYKIINYNPDDYFLLRVKLWKENYYTFTGVTAYSIYDYGILLTILLCVLYYFKVIRMKPRNNRISLQNLFLVVILIQFPLMGIFYSQAGGLFLPFIYYMFIRIYLKYTLKKKI